MYSECNSQSGLPVFSTFVASKVERPFGHAVSLAHYTARSALSGVTGILLGWVLLIRIADHVKT